MKTPAAPTIALFLLSACGNPIEAGYCEAVESWPQNAQAFEEEVLTLTNQARASARTCGSEGSFALAPALTMDPMLRCAARNHAKAMVEDGFFSHQSPDGEGPSDRVSASGYTWLSVGENIATGYISPATVVQGWLDSDGHCANLMGPDWQDIGVGYDAGTSNQPHFWVQVFGVAR